MILLAWKVKTIEHFLLIKTGGGKSDFTLEIDFYFL